ncbi:MAG: sigma-70 family RNA polymerase sigma factor [Acidobacteriota bacterium]
MAALPFVRASRPQNPAPDGGGQLAGTICRVARERPGRRHCRDAAAERSPTRRRPVRRGPLPAGIHGALRRTLVDGDARAWPGLIERYEPAIRRQAVLCLRRRGFGASPPEVDDHVQELWLRLVRAGSRYRGRDDVQAWAYLQRCLRHLVIDRLRRTTAERRAIEVDPEWCLWRGNRPRLRMTLDEVQFGRWRRRPIAPPVDSVTPETVFLRREALRGFARTCRRMLATSDVVAQRPLRARVDALCMAFVDGASSHQVSDALGGRPTAREVDRLATYLRGRLAARGIRLPRRAGRPA